MPLRWPFFDLSTAGLAKFAPEPLGGRVDLISAGRIGRDTWNSKELFELVKPLILLTFDEGTDWIGTAHGVFPGVGIYCFEPGALLR